jgi:Pentapeptide repeats (8 copies)
VEPEQENRGQVSGIERRPSRRLRALALIVLLTTIFCLLLYLLWRFVGPSTPKEQIEFVQAVVVLISGAMFLSGLYLIAQYLQIPYFGVGAMTFLVAVTVLWGLIKPTTVDQRIAFFQTMGGIVGGSALLFGLYFTAQTLRVNREGQITERFTRAIDQLGATDETTGKPRLEIRLGGVYALERIAWDSPERDYSTVMEVLTAYVRENTTQAPGPSKGSSDAALTSNEATAEADKGAKQPAPPEPRRPTADIQAILDVLGRAQDRVPEKYRTRLDLNEAILQNARLKKANLSEARLRRVDLRGADLRGADLREASLWGANLREADLREADLRGANLLAADLRGADLRGAILQAAKRMTQDQIESTIGSSETKLPEGRNRPKLWSKSLEEQKEILEVRINRAE